jgi:hypothetical protein
MLTFQDSRIYNDIYCKTVKKQLSATALLPRNRKYLLTREFRKW